MKNRLVIAVFFGTMLITTVQSQDREKIQFDGSTILESYVFTESLPDKEDSQNEWKTNIELSYRFNSSLQLKTSTQINLNTV